MTEHDRRQVKLRVNGYNERDPSNSVYQTGPADS